MSALPNLRSDLVAGIARDRARRRRRRLFAGAAALPLAVAAIAAAALLPAGSSHSPAQALAQATRQAADATAGHIVWTTTATRKIPTADGPTADGSTNTMDVRYQGNDVAIDTQNALRQADGAEHTVSQASTRIVDGVLYYGVQGAQPTQLATGASAGNWLADQTQALNALAAAAQSADDVTTQIGDGATTYTATIDATGLAIPGGPGVPVGYTLATGKAVAPNAAELTMMRFGLDGQATLQVTVTDGAVTAFTITQADGHFTVRADLTDLGQPQNITRP